MTFLFGFVAGLVLGLVIGAALTIAAVWFIGGEKLP